MGSTFFLCLSLPASAFLCLQLCLELQLQLEVKLQLSLLPLLLQLLLLLEKASTVMFVAQAVTTIFSQLGEFNE